MKKLSILSFLICLAVFALFAVACPNQAKQSNPSQKEEPEAEQENQDDDPDIPPLANQNIPYDVMAKSVHVALLDKDNKKKEYLPVKDFNETVSGPYAAAQNAETAYVYLKIEMEEQTGQGKDFSIYLQNISAWIPYINDSSKTKSENEKAKNEKQIFTLRRGKDTDSKFFLSRNPIPLSIGENILAVTIIPPDGNEENKGTYFITVNYDGGPGAEFVKKNNAPIPGIYCAAQRKTYKNEKKEFLWMIVVQGF